MVRAGKIHLPSGPVHFSFQSPLVKYYLPIRCTMFIPYKLTRLLRLISLAHWTTKLPFSFSQEQNLQHLPRAISPGFFPTLIVWCLICRARRNQVLNISLIVETSITVQSKEGVSSWNPRGVFIGQEFNLSSSIF